MKASIPQPSHVSVAFSNSGLTTFRPTLLSSCTHTILLSSKSFPSGLFHLLKLGSNPPSLFSSSTALTSFLNNRFAEPVPRRCPRPCATTRQISCVLASVLGWMKFVRATEMSAPISSVQARSIANHSGGVPSGVREI